MSAILLYDIRFQFLLEVVGRLTNDTFGGRPAVIFDRPYTTPPNVELSNLKHAFHGIFWNICRI